MVISTIENRKTPILNTCSPTTILLASRSFWVIIVRGIAQLHQLVRKLFLFCVGISYSLQVKIMKTTTKTKSISSHLSPLSVPQSEPLNDVMIKNSAGGYVYETQNWEQLDRFLILGTYGGTYYINERKLTIKNAEKLKLCFDENPAKYASRVREISLAGRATKNDFAVFALAFACAKGSAVARSESLKVLNDVCRTGTHLFQFINDYTNLGGGFGRSIKSALSNWYILKNLDDLSMQIVKYRNRNGWTHRDVFRKAHPKNEERNNIFSYVIKGYQEDVNYPEIINTFEKLKNADESQMVEIINSSTSVREMIPTEFLSNKNVLEALAMQMPPMAMVRNLGNMTRVLEWTNVDKSESLEHVVSVLSNEKSIKKARLHPMFILTALVQYSSGKGLSSSWTPVTKVVNALETAFKLSLSNVAPTNLRILQAVDVSGSMSAEATSNMSCSEASSAMAFVNSCTEPYVHNIAFSDKIDKSNVMLSNNMSINEVKKLFGQGGGTDLSLPVKWAFENKKEFDLIIIYTDNETWCGGYHTSAVWEQYSKKYPNAKLVVASVASNQYSVIDPVNPMCLQTVGFDSNLFNVIREWVSI